MDEMLVRIENIQQNLKIIDNIFGCMKTYWTGDSADSVQELYGELKEDISRSEEFLANIVDCYSGDEVKKLPGDIF